MNCYNCEKYLKDAIDSVYAQTYKDWEIIFIDNCSTDSSKNIIDQYDKKIKYYKTPQNLSLCQARVYAKEFITGEYFCVLDTDDLWMPNKLEKQIDIMNNYRDTGIVYTNTICFSENYEIPAYKNQMPSGYIFKDLFENYFFSFETVMVRKELMNKHTIYFDEKYDVSSDAEFFTKLSYFTNVHYINEPLAKWRFGHGSESDKSLCKFPKEADLLLKDLHTMIPDFDSKYGSSITKVSARINNMYGMCHWEKKNIKEAKMYFKKALQVNLKYLVPFLLSHFISYSNFKMIKKVYKKY